MVSMKEHGTHTDIRQIFVTRWQRTAVVVSLTLARFSQGGQEEADTYIVLV